MAQILTGVRRAFHRIVGDAGTTLFSTTIDFNLSEFQAIEILEKRLYVFNTVPTEYHFGHALSLDLDKASLEMDIAADVDDQDNLLLSHHILANAITTSGGITELRNDPVIVRPPAEDSLVVAQNVLSISEFQTAPPATLIALWEIYYRYLRINSEEFAQLFAFGRVGR